MLPDAAQHGAGQRHRRIRSVELVDGEDQARRRVAGHREVGRMQVERQLQVVREAAQLDQPIGLALRRALGQRQSAGDRKDLAEVDRADVDKIGRAHV